tara:strand:- start:429 stop:2588 length:2160 start_codon:yes stop_codon:yes gene_type:complete
MKIYNTAQYNEELGKFKLLSGTGGVGSIFTSKFNNYVLIKSNSNWGFIVNANNKIEETLNVGGNIENNNFLSLRNMGLQIVNDKRFLNFLKEKNNDLVALKALLEIPTLNLSEKNYIEWENRGQAHLLHPSAVRRAIQQGNDTNEYSFSIDGLNFPSWFMNQKGELKKVNGWKKDWNQKVKDKEKSNFAPPKEFIKRNENGRIYSKNLTQNNLMLICPNGHLSDVPWSKYLTWFTRADKSSDPECKKLFTEYNDCCDNPQLKWTENKSRSLGFESVFVHCENCRTGKSDIYTEKVNLRGIMGLSPYCIGEKPWEGNNIREDCKEYKNGERTNKSEQMKFVLATANNVYYANVESSLFLPEIDEYADLREAEKTFLQRFEDEAEDDESLIDFFNGLSDRVIQRVLALNNDNDKLRFQEIISKSNETFGGDIDLKFRHDEFKFFSDREDFNQDGLVFKNLELNENSNEYFKTIKIVEDLKVTSTQLEFSRVQPPFMVEDNAGNIIPNKPSQKVYKEGTHVLPAIQALGEGVFFEFDNNKINDWIISLDEDFKQRFSPIFNAELNNEDQGYPQRNRAKNDNYKLYLIHSFAHAFIRELEFSCGYPSASIRERLYVSNDETLTMQGFLLYTTEGAEGSMGGIITQCGTSEKVMELVKKAMVRAFECTSDPLCWEADKQGVFDLNRAACFSCSLLSETSCEMMNLSLDRQVLVNEENGYFKNEL